MADFGAPVANTGTYNPQQGIQGLAAVMGIKNAQEQNKILKAEAQQQQQSAGQRYGIAQWMQSFDPAKHVKADGTLDLDAVLSDPGLRKAAGDDYPEVVQKFIGMKQGQLQNKQALIGVNDSVRKGFQETISALRTDPEVVKDSPEGRQKIHEAIGQFAAQGPDNARIAGIYGPQVESVPQGKLAQYLSNVQLQAEDASTQASKQAPAYDNVGGKQVNVATQAAGAGQDGGPSVTTTPVLKNTVPPGNQPFTDSFGRVFNFNQQTGNYEPAQNGSGGVGAAAPGDVQAQTAQAEQNFKNVSANRMAASSAPQQLDQIKKAIDISKNVTTGAWTGERSKIESGLATIIPGIDTAKDDATKVQLLDKFLTRITNDSNKVLGVSASTDAERDSISRQNAQIGYTPEAIQKVLKYAGAQTAAMQAKGDAQETWLKQPNHGITNQQDFETSWRKAYDPVIFQLEQADPREQMKIIKGLSPQEAKSLQQKRAELKVLGVQLQ